MPHDRFIVHDDERIPYGIVRSARRTVAIVVGADAAVLVRAPHRVSEREVERLLLERAGWVARKREEIGRLGPAVAPAPLGPKERAEARRLLAGRLDVCWAAFARPGEEKPTLRVRVMRSRWGSLIEGRRMSLNARLARAPVECIDSVVYHELCHMREAGHGPEFYRELARYVPDWKARRSELRRLVL
ncbi:MAG: DUF45 domain-containing protein [Coriobacteriia bacterium]|nr:DUF45 domain-containing protein [Coriobacteriia bacterium]